MCGTSVPLVAVCAGLMVAGVAEAAPRLLPVASGFNQPLFMTAPAGDSRLFVVEKTGRIRIVNNGVVSSTPFLDLSSRVATGGERGLLGLTFAPDYATSGKFYVNYIDRGTLNTVVSQFTVGSSPGVANAGSERVVLTVTQPSGRDNHKGGWIGFRPGDANNLYIATGDGGSSNDPDNNAQNVSSQLGKILRVNLNAPAPSAEGTASGSGIPGANPFVWDYGLRNPYRNSFDRLTGTFFIGDVGQGRREEVNVELASNPGGNNYGWRPLEGTIPTPDVGDPIPPGTAAPAFEYDHGGNAILSPSGSASIIGGYVYRGSDAPELYGKYVFGDFVSGRLATLDFNSSTGSLSNLQSLTAIVDPNRTLFGGNSLSSFGEDANGNLYLANIATGTVYRLVPEPSGLAVLGVAVMALASRRR